jgi:hypothetical protein
MRLPIRLPPQLEDQLAGLGLVDHGPDGSMRASPQVAIVFVLMLAASVGVATSMIAGYAPGYRAFAVLLMIAASALAVVTDPVLLVAAMLIMVVFFGEGFNPSAADRFVFYRVGLAHIYLFEALTWLAIISLLVRRRARITHVSRPFVILIGLLELMMVSSAIHGWQAGAALQDAFGYYEWRAWFMAMALMGALILTLSVSDIRLLLRTTVFASVIHAVQGLVLFALGRGDIHPTTGARLPYFDSMEGALFTLGSLYAFSAAYHSRDSRGRVSWGLAGAVMMITLILDRRRSYWVAFAVGGVMLWLFRVLRHSRTLSLLPMTFLASDVALTVPAVLSSVFAFLTALFRFIHYSGRGETLGFHLLDINDAGRAIWTNPITFTVGRGMGLGYTRVLSLLAGGAAVTTRVVHSIYMTVWFKMGLLGLTVFMALVVGVLAVGLRRLQWQPDWEQDIFLAVLVGFSLDFVVGTDLFGNTRYPILFGVLLAAIILKAEAAKTFTNKHPTLATSGPF